MELLEIEKELAGPDRENALARYDAKLVALSERAAAALKAGLPPDEYQRTAELVDAVTVARKLLRLQMRK